MWFFLSCKHACMGAVCLRMPVIGKSYQAEVAGIIRTGSWLWKNGAVPGWRRRAPAGNSDGSVACGRRGRSARCPAWSWPGQTGWEACPVDCKGVESPGWDEEEDCPGTLCWFRWQRLRMLKPEKPDVAVTQDWGRVVRCSECWTYKERIECIICTIKWAYLHHNANVK